MATTAYTITVPAPASVPAGIVVRIVAMREDGKPLSREELSALVDAYPPPPESRAEAEQAIADAPSRAPKASAPRSSGASKTRPKRAAAKAPSRSK